MKKVEVFSAGCALCEDTIVELNGIAGSKEVTILDMDDPAVVSRAKSLGIASIPAVLVNGKPADCCAGRGVDVATVKAALA